MGSLLKTRGNLDLVGVEAVFGLLLQLTVSVSWALVPTPLSVTPKDAWPPFGARIPVPP